MRNDEDTVLVQRPAPRYRRRPPGPAGFPGCRPVRIRCEELVTYEGRFEYWDADTETAWVVSEPTSPIHEHPSQRLAGLGQLIAAVRGSPIECFGTMDLLLRNARGERWRIMQADQSVYLHPDRARLPGEAAMTVGEDDLPDVVLEVDHTTDVRRGKLGFYEEWGFPEVWVDVPERRARSRAADRRPGLTIHLLAGGAYREAPESEAFPGWKAAEIHAALNEPALSTATSRVLDRVGRALGVREGTGPDDTPWLRAHRREGHTRGFAEGRDRGRAEGIAEGRDRGRAEGIAEGRAVLMTALVRRTLAARGIAGGDLTLDADDLEGMTDEEIIDVALQCKGEVDLHARLRRRPR